MSWMYVHDNYVQAWGLYVYNDKLSSHFLMDDRKKGVWKERFLVN